MHTVHFNFKQILIIFAIASLTLGSFLVFTTKTFAATGINRTMNFQGRLVRNDAGSAGLNVANGTYSIVFSLYNHPTAGTPGSGSLWSETQGSVTVTDGIFRVALGSSTAFPANFNFNWDGLYLGVKVGADSEMTPRIQMAAVPFAFNAQQVAGLTIQDSATSAGSTSATLKIGTSATNPITVDLGLNNVTFNTGSYVNAQLLTITSSGTTSVTLPSSGTLLTNTAAAVQTLTSTQTTGTVLGIADSTTQIGNVIGQTITLSGATGSLTQTGLQFNLSGATSGIAYDVQGTSNNWGITRAGALALAGVYGNNGDCLKSGGSGTSAMSWAACGGAGGTNYWNLATGAGGGYITPINSTADFLFGSQATNSASFHLYGSTMLSGTQPVASIAAKTSFAGLVIDQAGVGDIFTASFSGSTRFTVSQSGMVYLGKAGVVNGGLTFYSSGSSVTPPTITTDSSGNLILSATNNSTATVQVGSGTGNIALSLSRPQDSLIADKTVTLAGAYTSNDFTFKRAFTGGVNSQGGAVLYVTDVSGGSGTINPDLIFGESALTSGTYTGNLLRLRSAGADKFTISNAGTISTAGNLGFTGTNPSITNTSTNTLTLNFGSTGDLQFFSSSYKITSAGALTVASCTGCGGGGVNYWGIANGLLYNGNLSTDFAIGGTSSTSAKFLISQSGTMPTASVSAKTSFAGLVVDQAGVGDIFTASAAGATRFRIAQNGSILMQGQTIASVGVGGTNTTSGSVINAIGDQNSMIPNSGFESNLTKSVIADGWAYTASSAATLFTRDTTSPAKGNTSLKVVLTNTSTAIFSTCIPLAGDTANSIGYVLNWYAKATTPIPTVRGYIDSYTSQANCMSNTSPTLSAAQGAAITTTWAKYGANLTKVTIAAAATWGRARIFIGSGATNATVNIDGIRLGPPTLGSGLDLAEYYPADPNNIPQAGDVVSVQSASGSAQVVPSSQFMDNSVIGVISTNPGQVLDDSSVPDPKVIVALAGRTPVKVSSKNGPIQIGDYLASSDVPGVAVKATMAGPVIGTAMEDYTDPDPQSIGKVVVFIKNTYFNGVSIASSSGLNLNGKDASVILAMVKDSANSSNSISLSLTKDGQFAIKDGNGNSVITFDNQGNAFFKGLIVADKIKANQIEGLDIFANRISALEAKTAVLSDATGSAELATASASLPPALTLTSLNVDGLATVSADLNVGGNGFIQGALNVLNDLTTKNLLVSQFAYFIQDVVFKGNVRFNSTPTFNNDTAGFAVIQQGLDTVQVNFSQEYVNTPVVTVSIALNKTGDSVSQKTLEDQILNGNISYVITQRTTKGFVVRLSKPAAEDINFSWMALSVQDAKTSGLNLDVTPQPAATNSAAFQSILNQLNGGGGN